MGLIGLLVTVLVIGLLFVYHPFLSFTGQQEQKNVGEQGIESAQQIKNTLQARDAHMMEEGNR